MREDNKILVNALFTQLTKNWQTVNNTDGTVNHAELMTLLLQTISEKPKTVPIEEIKQRSNGRLSYDDKVNMAARFIKMLSATGGWNGKDRSLAEMQTLEKVKVFIRAGRGIKKQLHKQCDV